ncbi:hypothetical protein WBJ53_13810 [Spirosoma sp. SC4-14]|uniref:hypothetical protein n=1 Tax=Spirosoma sp. SC4-14 TaxID=3128900 RepID=UPI0030CAECCA
MKKKDLDQLVALHTRLLSLAKQQLDNFYENMSDEEQGRWLNEYRKQSQILRWLNEQLPDSDE